MATSTSRHPTRLRLNNRLRARQATVRAAQDYRRTLVAQYVCLQRMTYRQCWEALAAQGIQTTLKTVCTDVQAILAEGLEARRASVAKWRELSAIRLDQIDRQLLPLAMGQFPPVKTVTIPLVSDTTRDRKNGKTSMTKGKLVVQQPLTQADGLRIQLEALKQLLRSDESRRRLYGVDAQPDHGTVSEQVAAALQGITREMLLELSDQAEKRARIAAIIRRWIAPAPTAITIDVDPASHAGEAGEGGEGANGG
jgi:hypothetical protein